MAARKRTASANEMRSGRFAYDGLDRVFHEKARLGIMTSLMTRHEGLSFPDLKQLCALSDGNLNRHLAVLQDAGFIEVEKEGGGRNSRSLCQVSRSGRTAFLQYLAELERVLADAATAQQSMAAAKEQLRPGWSAS
jgi:DNA-binding transcriptional ArsR family regulator